MFACLYSLSSPLAALVALAERFTPRFEVVGSVVLLDVSGLSRLFGSPRDIGEHLRRAAAGPVRIAIATTQTAAALLALGRPGLTVAPDDHAGLLAALPASVLAEFERLRFHDPVSSPSSRRGASLPDETSWPPQAVDGPQARRGQAQELENVSSGGSRDGTRTGGAEQDSPRAAAPVLPDRHSAVDPTSARQSTPAGGGWMHPRDSHAAAHARRPRRDVATPRHLEHAPPAAGAPPPARAPRSVRTRGGQGAASRAAHVEVQALGDTLRRWGIRTLGELAALPAGEVYERLGARGVAWQRLARGDDASPLVPWVAEEPFEAALALEWPIEGLEPLSFVLGRLCEPLAERLERADRGAAILHTHLRLVDKTVHARTLQLPAPMRDPKTLRTLVLLDLESHPPAAAIDHVRVLAEPTPARVTQWTLFERAQPSPEQVSTLLARLAALMGDSHVGSPRLVDTWKPGAFEMVPFEVRGPEVSSAPPRLERPGREAVGAASADRFGSSAIAAPLTPSHLGAERRAPADCAEAGTALRRFRLPVPARVQVQEGRPVRVITDRRGVTGGAVVQAAGPWRTSGEWWHDSQPGRAWDRDEWDVALADGTVYRLYVERGIGQWFLEGIVD